MNILIPIFYPVYHAHPVKMFFPCEKFSSSIEIPFKGYNKPKIQSENIGLD